MNKNNKDLDKIIKDQAREIQRQKRQLDSLNSIIGFMPEHVYWKDRNGVYLGCNDTQAQSLGLNSRDEIVGKTDYDLVWKNEAAVIIANDMEVMKTGIAKIAEEQGKLPNGQWLIGQTHKVPLRNRQGDIVGILGISVNITQRKQMEEQLQQAKEQAEEANRAKTEFIFNMEHDLRTPAGGVYALADILANNETNSKKKKNLQLMSNSAKELLNLLNDILIFQQTESGQFPLMADEVAVRGIVNGVVDLEKAAALGKSLEIINDYDDNIPGILIGDEYRLRRILINLVSNAIKFTHKGYVKIFTSLVDDSRDDNIVVLRFVVEDSGIGMPKNKQSIIYNRFTRLNPSNQGIYKGSGLGLSIVKQFIEELDGNIEVESEEGQGARFICILPLKLPIPLA